MVTPLVVLYDTFFARLFLLEPSMQKMFDNNMVRQSKFLVGLVNLLVREWRWRRRKWCLQRGEKRR